MTFLEFFNALILCTELGLKLKAIEDVNYEIESGEKKSTDENNKKNNDDVSKDVRTVSSKKSRPIGMNPAITKTGKT